MGTRERLPAHHRHVRCGAVHGRGRLRGRRLVRDRQHAAVAADRGGRGGRRARVRARTGSPSSSAGAAGPRWKRPCPPSTRLRAQGHRVRVVYLDAPHDVLVRRFEGTRRRHPSCGSQVDEAITDERRLLEPVRARADIVVDTGELNVNQLRHGSPSCFGDDSELGHAHVGGVLRVQARRAPRRRPRLRLPVPAQPPLGRGAAPAVGPRRAGARLRARPGGHRAPSSTGSTTSWGSLLPAYEAEGKSYLTIALGLHGRAAPLGGAGRGGRRPPARARGAAARRHPPGRGPVTRRRPGPRVVAVGGGHGLAATLRRRAALRRASSPAVVRWPTTGGRRAGCAASSASCRPATCASAWWRWPRRTRALAAAFEHRFEAEELVGHALGNLVIAGLMAACGDLQKGLDEAARLLGAVGRVVPAATEPVVLKAESDVGEIEGQTEVMADRRHPPGVARARRPPRLPGGPRRARRGRPGRDRSRLAVHERARRRGRARPGRGHPASPGAGSTWPTCGPSGRETAGFDVAAHVAALAAHGVEIDVVRGRPGLDRARGTLGGGGGERPAGQGQRAGPRSGRLADALAGLVG